MGNSAGCEQEGRGRGGGQSGAEPPPAVPRIAGSAGMPAPEPGSAEAARRQRRAADSRHGTPPSAPSTCSRQPRRPGRGRGQRGPGVPRRGADKRGRAEDKQRRAASPSPRLAKDKGGTVRPLRAHGHDEPSIRHGQDEWVATDKGLYGGK